MTDLKPQPPLKELPKVQLSIARVDVSYETDKNYHTTSGLLTARAFNKTGELEAYSRLASAKVLHEDVTGKTPAEQSLKQMQVLVKLKIAFPNATICWLHRIWSKIPLQKVG